MGTDAVRKDFFSLLRLLGRERSFNDFAVGGDAQYECPPISVFVHIGGEAITFSQLVRLSQHRPSSNPSSNPSSDPATFDPSWFANARMSDSPSDWVTCQAVVIELLRMLGKLGMQVSSCDQDVMLATWSPSSVSGKPYVEQPLSSETAKAISDRDEDPSVRHIYPTPAAKTSYDVAINSHTPSELNNLIRSRKQNVASSSPMIPPKASPSPSFAHSLPPPTSTMPFLSLSQIPKLEFLPSSTYPTLTGSSSFQNFAPIPRDSNISNYLTTSNASFLSGNIGKETPQYISSQAEPSNRPTSPYKLSYWKSADGQDSDDRAKPKSPRVKFGDDPIVSKYLSNIERPSAREAESRSFQQATAQKYPSSSDPIKDAEIAEVERKRYDHYKSLLENIRAETMRSAGTTSGTSDIDQHIPMAVIHDSPTSPSPTREKRRPKKIITAKVDTNLPRSARKSPIPTPSSSKSTDPFQIQGRAPPTTSSQTAGILGTNPRKSPRPTTAERRPYSPMFHPKYA